MRNIAVPLASIALVLLLVGCSSGSGGSGNNAPTALDLETAAAYQNLAYQGSQYQLSILQEPISFEVASVRTTSGASVPKPVTALLATSGVEPQQTTDCITESGNTTDADGDTIPVSASYTYDCSEVDPDSGTSFSLTGSVSISDENDASASGGYTLAMSDLNYSLTSNGRTATFEFDLKLDLAVQGARYDAAFDFAFAISGPDGSAGFEYDVDQTYVADDVSDPFSSGSLDFSGNLSLLSDGSLYSLEVSGPNHVVDDYCSTGYRHGTTTYRDNAGNTVTVNYGCNTATARYNGDHLATY